ncbi:hypothetical protein SDJN03_17124, partial [Cucurbita argyrosperma subsp. sororia]
MVIELSEDIKAALDIVRAEMVDMNAWGSHKVFDCPNKAAFRAFQTTLDTGAEPSLEPVEVGTTSSENSNNPDGGPKVSIGAP